LDVQRVKVLLTNLGFLLVPGPPLDHGAAYLLVALRPRPTLAHFDPERIKFWGYAADKCVPLELSWPIEEFTTRYSWGSIRMSDRVKAQNTFVSFGGALTTSRDGDVHAALFRSEAPILSVAGRSEPSDPLAVQAAAFLARLRGLAGYDSPAHELAQSLTPMGLYAAFLWHVLENYGRPDADDWASPHVLSLLRAERRRLETDCPVPAAAGQRLADMITEGSD